MKNMTYKVGMISLGCPKNQVDAEMILSDVAVSHKYVVTNDTNEADIVIINTCGFIEDAKKESIDYILEYCDLKGNTNLKKVVVSGCLAERYKEDINSEIPEVDAVIGIGSNKDIVTALDTIMNGGNFFKFDKKNELNISGTRMISTPKHYAYLKISEGCNKTCAFCAIPSIRGEFRSRTIEDIVKEARVLVDMGTKEILVVSQDTTRYGEDIYGKVMLKELLKELCTIENLRWIRIMYCYPNDMTDDVLDIIAIEPKIVKYLEIPIQHVSKNVLAGMRRGGNVDYMRKLMTKMREKIEDIAIRTSFIVGFPEESEEDFTELHQFIKDVKIDRVGCFIYSKEEGTIAYGMDNQIDEDIKSRRFDLLMFDQSIIMEEINKSKVGKVMEVIVDEFDEDENIFLARTQFDAPGIDGVVKLKFNDKIRVGEFYKVKILDVQQYDLVGEII